MYMYQIQWNNDILNIFRAYILKTHWIDNKCMYNQFSFVNNKLGTLQYLAPNRIFPNVMNVYL